MRKVAVKVVTGIGFVVVLLFSMSAFAAQTKAFEFPLQNKTISLGSDVTAIKSAFPQIKKTKISYEMMIDGRTSVAFHFKKINSIMLQWEFME